MKFKYKIGTKVLVIGPLPGSTNEGTVQIVKRRVSFAFRPHYYMENTIGLFAEDEIIPLPENLSPLRLEFLKLLYK